MTATRYVSVLLFLGVVRSQRLSAGDVCTMKSNGNPGTCKLLPDCDKAKDDLQKFMIFPQTCGFEGTVPLVCCEEEYKPPPSPSTTTSQPTPPYRPNRNPGVLSKRRCREYAAYVFETSISPVLSLNPPNSTTDHCGHKVETLIIGGEEARTKEFPHMAAIGYETGPNEIKWLCGGTIINRQYILTAAHCLISKEWGTAKHVRMGMKNLDDITMYRQQFRIAERIRYPEYRPSSHYHDIALIKLEKPAQMTPYARPACLYTKDVIGAQKAIATGWGDTSYGGVRSDTLLKVTLDLFDHDFCNKSYKNQVGRRLKKGILDDMQVCAGSKDPAKEKDTCQGDSGGPLQIYHVGDDVYCMYDIVGVTSFGKACSGSPGVYTRVSNYIKWIEDIVWP